MDGYSLKAETDERGRGRERGRDRREREREKFRDSQDGRYSQKQSTTDQHFIKVGTNGKKVTISLYGILIIITKCEIGRAHV